MLIKCPECELQVSDKANACPHCGYPMVQNVAINGLEKPRKAKRMRLSNGFGRITEIKTGNLRNRFRVIVTVGKTTDGKYIGKALKPRCLFPTYNEAYAALVEYHKSPYDLDNDLKVSELYEKWSETYFETLKNTSSVRVIRSAWRYCDSIKNMTAKSVRARHLKGCIDEGYRVENGTKIYPSANIKSRMKSLFNLMFDYAVEYELVDKNYARTFNLSDEIVNEKEKLRNAHIPFSDEEMKKLWNTVDSDFYIGMIIIQCYMGWRPQELGLIRMSDVDLEKWIIIGGMKTEAGTNRPVPIHPKIRWLILKYHTLAEELGSEYLFNCIDGKTHKGSNSLTYDKYAKRFAKIRDNLNLNPDHRPHDPRAHFITLCKKYDVDEYAIKYLAGHSITDITEKIYTTRDVEWLKKEVEKIE